jgi:tRNA threonylcarbamoyladenosine biosynthesis protein TsaB
VRILAVETATAASSVAIGSDGRLAAMAVEVDARGHLRFLTAAADFCFARAGWAPLDVDAIVVDTGPGRYTGLRAGIATAQGIAAAIGAPLVTVSSLSVLALRAATGRRRIWPVIDVRRGQIATQPFRPVPGGVVADGVAEVMAVEELRGLLEADPADSLVVGDWESLPEAVLRGLHRVKRGRPRYPSADVVLEIGELKAARDDFVTPEQVRPVYLREPDARINWAQISGRGPADGAGPWPGAAP